MDSVYWVSLPGLPKKVKWPVKVDSWSEECTSVVHVYNKSDDAYFDVKTAQLIPFVHGQARFDEIKTKSIAALKRRPNTLDAFLSDVQWALDESRTTFSSCHTTSKVEEQKNPQWVVGSSQDGNTKSVGKDKDETEGQGQETVDDRVPKENHDNPGFKQKEEKYRAGGSTQSIRRRQTTQQTTNNKVSRLARTNQRCAYKSKQYELARQSCRKYGDPDGFEIQFIDENIGKGVFTTKSFLKEDFLLEYHGDLIKNYKKALQLEKEYAKANFGSFMYYFKFKGKNICVDATNHISRHGRIVNDAPRGDALNNCDPNIVLVDDIPHLCFFANRDIAEGEELRFDYGCRNLPWRKKSAEKPNDACQSYETVQQDSPTCVQACGPLDSPASVQACGPLDSSASVQACGQLDSPASVQTCGQLDSPTSVQACGQLDYPTSVQTCDQLDSSASVQTCGQLDYTTIVQAEKIQSDACQTVQLDSPTSFEASPQLDSSASFEACRQLDSPASVQACSQLDSSASVQTCGQLDYTASVQAEKIQSDACQTVQLDSPTSFEASPQLDSSASFEACRQLDSPASVQACSQLDSSASVQTCGQLDYTASVQAEKIQSDASPTVQLYSPTSFEASPQLDSTASFEVCRQLDSLASVQTCGQLDSPTSVQTCGQLDYPTSVQTCDQLDSSASVQTCGQLDYMAIVQAGKIQSVYSIVDTDKYTDEFVDDESDKHSYMKSDDDNSEYLPTSDNQSIVSDSDMSEDEPIPPIPDISILLQEESEPTPSTSNIDKEESSDDNLIVDNVKVNDLGRRVWDKKHCCVFCSKLFAKLPRHFEQKHRNELEVIEALSLPMKSKERKAKWRVLMNKGDFLWNKQAVTENKGTIIPFKRPSFKDQYKTGDYLPCEHCFAFFLKHELWRHSKKCPGKKTTVHIKGVRHQSAGASLLVANLTKNEKYEKCILSTMANDSISFIARHDETILRYGEKLFGKSGEPHQYQYVKQKMRELGRFLLAARKSNSEVHSMQDILNPVIFTSVIAAVKSVTGFDQFTGQYKIPSLALKLGHSLKHCGKILLTKAIVSGQQDLKQSAKEFETLCCEEWGSEVSSLALKNLHTRKFNTPKRLPVADDLQKLNKYLEDVAAQELKELQESPNQRTWRNLASVTLAQLVLFNRRRGGETERMEFKQYTKGIMSSGEMQQEIAQCLSPFEKRLAESLKRVEIRGKRGRCVPVLLTKKHCSQLEAICKTRNTCGILSDNRFVFAREGNAQTPIRSADVLRKYAVESGAKHPELISSTSLRKHVATISQILSLKDNELDSLANFLGHDVNIHRQYYRLPDDTIQLAKISKLLLEVENGTISLHKGKTLDDIQLDAEEPLEEEEEEQGEMEEEEGEEREEVGEEENLETVAPAPVPACQGKKAVKRKMWTKNETDAVKRQLEKYFVLDKLPGKHEIEEARTKEPLLLNREWVQIKSFIKNCKVSKQRKLQTHGK